MFLCLEDKTIIKMIDLFKRPPATPFLEIYRISSINPKFFELCVDSHLPWESL